MKSVPSENMLALKIMTEKITRTPSENMLALKLLTEKLTRDEFEDYKNIIKELVMILDEVKLVQNEKTNKDKLKCYEGMYTTITDLLKDIILY
jgi:hypothetical protein